MIATPQQQELLTICALRTDSKSVDWSLIARTCQSPEALEVVLGGDIPEDSTVARNNLSLLRKALPAIDDARARVATELQAAEKAGARLVTVLDSDYPAKLRLVPNLPPFLFHLGDLEEKDARSAAIVGTRNASEDGMRRAARMARLLVAEDVVIFSGLELVLDLSQRPCPAT
ncbi:DNA-processing protein DprA [Streptomyces griseosporeus]|uniref:DNA-processing protein DprA n=1 Tax=Streptomyces griseosporeus TaxID=1910 RepID=UPI0036A007C6